MKKIIVIMLAVVMILVFASCEKTGKDEGTTCESTSSKDTILTETDLSSGEESFDDSSTELEDDDHDTLELKKDSIPNTADWKTAGLESAGLSSLTIEVPTEICADGAYILTLDGYAMYFAFETPKTVWLEPVPYADMTPVKAKFGTEIYAYDVDGEGGNEMIVKADTGGNGGYGSFDIIIYKIKDNGVEQLIHTNRMNMPDNGFSAKLMAPFRLEMKNKHTGYSETFDIKGVFAPKWIFDKYGNPGDSYIKDINYDCIYEMLFEDVDLDGVYELLCRQYTYCGWTANDVGIANTIFKYDKDSGTFKVIDAFFEPSKVSTVEKSPYFEVINDGWNYDVYIYDIDGEVFFCDRMEKVPQVSLISDSIVELCVQAGTGLSTNWAMFFDVENGTVSETFQYVLGAEDNYVIFGDYDSETDQRYIVVQNIFDTFLYYEKIHLENASPVAADFAAIDPIGDGKWEITYLVGEEYNQEKLTITLP